MPAIDYDRSGALFFGTVDDTADANVFGQNCLDLPAEKVGDLVVKDTIVSLVDSFSEFRFYGNGIFEGTGMSILMGARVNTSSNNDGYYGGLDTQFFPSAGIFTRISGVLTQLTALHTNVLVVDTEYIMQFVVVGSSLEVRIIRASDLLQLDAATITDTTFTNAGTGSILKPAVGPSNRRLRIDKHSISTVV